MNITAATRQHDTTEHLQTESLPTGGKYAQKGSTQRERDSTHTHTHTHKRLYIVIMSSRNSNSSIGKQKGFISLGISSSCATLQYMYIVYDIHVYTLWVVSIVTSCNYTMYVHVLMRDEKESRMKQRRSNKQQGKATLHIQGSTHVMHTSHTLYQMYTYKWKVPPTSHTSTLVGVG